MRPHNEPGIHFLAEWLSNRLAVMLGPATFGLPYRHGKLAYRLRSDGEPLRGRVSDPHNHAQLSYHGNLNAPSCFQPSEEGSLTEWLMERYTAFNAATTRKKFFRVWHPPWPQCEAEIELNDISLLSQNWPRLADAQLVGANYSPGFNTVWMGRPHLFN